MMPTTVQDAIRLDQDCSGRIGRVEVDLDRRRDQRGLPGRSLTS